MRKLIFIAVITSIFLISGCASLFEGQGQYTMIATINDEERTETICLITNEEGTWPARAYQNAYIHKDGNAVTVVCRNSKQIGQTQMGPDFSFGWLALNFLGDYCIFSCPVDAYTNALYSYPDRIYVPMSKKTPESK